MELVAGELESLIHVWQIEAQTWKGTRLFRDYTFTVLLGRVYYTTSQQG